MNRSPSHVVHIDMPTTSHRMARIEAMMRPPTMHTPKLPLLTFRHAPMSRPHIVADSVLHMVRKGMVKGMEIHW